MLAWLIVGGTMPCFIANIAAMDSIAPAAPKQVTGHRFCRIDIDLFSMITKNI